jgi:hypothetical protein
VTADARRAARTAAATDARWSLLIYMTVGRGLRAYEERTLKELCEHAPPELTISVQIDRRGRPPPQRYRIAGGERSRLTSRWAYDASTGLRDFIDWALPADDTSRAFLVTWGDGTGWTDRTGLVRDDADGVTDQEFREAIEGSRRGRMDIIGCDACLMSTIEVAYGLHGMGDVLVASETPERLGGWPYPHLLRALARRPTMRARDFAARTVRSIDGDEETVTALTAFDLERVHRAGGAFKALTARLRRIVRSRWADIARARKEALRVGDPRCVDVVSLTRALRRRVDDPPLAGLTAAFERELRGARVAHAALGPENSGMNGISVYFPAARSGALSPPFASYKRIEFARATGWGAFLESYYDAVGLKK